MCDHILVVDDDEAIRHLLQEVLIDEGYAVDTANDGLIAWIKLTQHPERYKVILLDIRMPRLDGLQLIQLLREQQQVSLSSIIVVSSDYDGIQQASGLGVRHVVRKPFDLEAVLAMITTVNLVESVR